MKAKKLLRLYADGRRDFREENLRGQSFKDENLSGADFSGADIRGADFTNADLREAEFVGAKAGLQRRWAVSLVLTTWLLLGISGLLSAFAGVFIASILENSSSIEHIIAGWVSLAILVIFWIVVIRKGVLTAFGFSIFLVAAVAVAAAAVATAVAVAATAVAAATETAVATAVAAAVVTAVAAIAAVAAVAAAEAATLTTAGAVAGYITGSFAAAAVAFPIAAAGAVNVTAASAAAAVAAAVAVALLNSYIGWRAIKGDPRDAPIRAAAIAFAATGGTSFREADLTDADFTNAILKSTDLRGATLTRTCWKNAIKLDLARPGTSYLKDPKIRELVRTGAGPGGGQELNCDDLNLQGVNLQGANLQHASFIRANLNEANLQGADLSRAKLVQTQLDKTNLADATLTAACIEDWGITTDTKLEGVKCQYVFVRLPTKEDPDPWRKPDNRQEEFGEGDFIDFIKPLQTTLDLYHNQQVDPRTVAAAFNQLKVNNSKADLSIYGFEFRGENNDKFLLKVKTNKGANHSELRTEYFETYNQYQSLPFEAYQYLLAEKDNQIKLLVGQINEAIKMPKISAEHYHNEGNTMAEDKSSGPDLRGAKFGGGYAGRDQKFGGGIAGRDQTGGNINDYSTVSESKQPLAEAAREIQQLLKQLEESNPSPTETEQIAYLTDETSPGFKRRAVNALKSGGQAAIEEFLDNPYVNVAIATIEGWQEKD